MTGAGAPAALSGATVVTVVGAAHTPFVSGGHGAGQVVGWQLFAQPAATHCALILSSTYVLFTQTLHPPPQESPAGAFRRHWPVAFSVVHWLASRRAAAYPFSSI